MFSGLASAAFFYVYKKSHLLVMLLAGIITYLELLCRLFLVNSPTTSFGLQLFMIPELLIILYMIYYTWRDGFNLIPIMIIGLISTFLIMISIGHVFYGDLGVLFGLIMIIWVNQSVTPCNVNPFECSKHNTDADRCRYHGHSRLDDWRDLL